MQRDPFPAATLLSLEERRTLLTIARAAIAAELEGCEYATGGTELSENLLRPAGAFVTLTVEGALRGCIGSVVPVHPLHRTVAVSSCNAAFRDPRFYPLRRDELSSVAIEISVLGWIEQVRDVASIMVGRDGLIVRKGRAAGLLLPQVAIEHRWSATEFLARTCEKAGLPADAWSAGGCTIEKFPAEVFREPRSDDQS